jgi:hypothetical protein
MKAMGLLLAGVVLLAANQPATVCAETESIDLKALAQDNRDKTNRIPVVTASDVLGCYDRNAVAADKIFLFTLVRVSGRIQEVGTTIDDHYFVRLTSESYFSLYGRDDLWRIKPSILCLFSRTNRDDVAKLAVRDDVTISGICTGMKQHLLGGPTFTDCSVIANRGLGPLPSLPRPILGQPEQSDSNRSAKHKEHLTASGSTKNGIAAFNVGASPFEAYDKKLIVCVQGRWFALIEKNGLYERSGNVTIKFQLLPDGSVSNVKVKDTSVGEILALFCQKAIVEASPFEPLPDSLREKAGTEPREVVFTFNY